MGLYRYCPYSLHFQLYLRHAWENSPKQTKSSCLTRCDREWYLLKKTSSVVKGGIFVELKWLCRHTGTSVLFVEVDY